MAVEPTAVDSSADVPAQLTTSQNINDSQDATINAPSVNGTTTPEEIEKKRITNVEEQANSADQSVSGGSDNEATRADGSKDKDGDKGHLRTGSAVKKPATFKAVSVNKKFLAAKSGTTSPSPGLGDKIAGTKTPPPGSGTLTASRPRLVAKTGSGTRDSLPKFSAGASGGKPATAPDPSVVWNRNRPPEPKVYTDEELKKYGIHMASRLKEDDASGQNKWADIDDDDDDWAPETITWGDGTKTTLPHHDDQPAPSAEIPAAAPAAAPVPVKAEAKPRPPVLASTIPPPTKSSGLASGKGLILKAASQEKPTLVAKPPAPPAPVKSPWAPIPTVERASPVAPEPVSQPPRGPPTHYRDPQQHAPKEIAADDFSRSAYRDGSVHGRELYNSNSGLYEPVGERRGSRHDPHARHPAVLQRSHGGDNPAEPSAAFQTHRSGQEHSFGRRRASSNLSGGSGAYFQRGPKGAESSIPPSEILGARRPSLAGSVESPRSHHVQPVPGQGQARAGPSGGWPQSASPHQAYAAPHDQHGPPPPMPPGQDDVELQQKIMRESREQARKRRLEEEARLEEEKKERIRKKLESLGPAPEKKSEQQEPTPKVISRPTQIQTRESKDATQQITEAIKELHQSKPELEPATTAQEGSASRPRRSSMNNVGSLPPSSRRMSSGHDSRRPDLWSGPGARPERFPPWGPNTQPTTQAVWGSPNNNKGLGNGTFSSDLGRISDPAGPPAPPGQGPAPIGPPGATRSSIDTRSQPPAPIGSRPSRYASTGSDLASKWINGVAENDKKLTAERLAERMQRDAQLAERGINLEDAQPQIKDTWRPVHASEGTRRPISSLDGVPPPPPPNPAGVIGSKSSSVLSQAAPGQQHQGRMSRFFPTNPPRLDSQDHAPPVRSMSPSPPPPTMDDHPAYEGDAMHPHVSLPRPQPRVKLPPSAAAAVVQASQASQASQQFSWANSGSFSNVVRGPPPPMTGHPGQGSQRVASTSQADWQNRFNSLLHTSKATSPPKAMGVDPASRSALDHSLHHDAATVSLPGKNVSKQLAYDPKSTITKPMAEECFEEQEMGSLPQIKLPHETPELAWNPAADQTRPFPKRFWVQPTNSESFYFVPEVSGGNIALKICVPGMKEAKVVSVPNTMTRGGRGIHGRPGPRTRGISGRGGKRDPASPRAERDSVAEPSRGRGRGSYRSRGSDNWSRQPSSSHQASIST